MKKIMILLFFIWWGCKALPYEDDIAYMSPDKANNPDHLILINGKACKDILGNIGICAIKHQIKKPLIFKLLPQSYVYSLDFRCGNASGIVFRKQVDILEKKEFEFEFPQEIMNENGYVTCIGDIFSLSDSNSVSSFFESRIRFYSENYIEPSEIYETKYKGKKYLVLGQHAFRSLVQTKTKKFYLKEQTVFRFKTDIICAIVETKNMRHRYFRECDIKE